MSQHDCPDPDCREEAESVTLMISPGKRDLGGFSVRRSLPSPRQRMVGPFIFFDHLGPAALPAGEGIDVRPHPHIGLATITWLFEGAIMHRDSLGSHQLIEPGAVNLMTAGHGIVHSERSGDDRKQDATLHALQLWIALPDEKEECEPAFEHIAADQLPSWSLPHDQGQVTLVLGEAWGRRSPAHTHSETLFAIVEMKAGSRLDLPDWKEGAVYAVDGQLKISSTEVDEGQMAILDTQQAQAVEALEDSRIALIGGDPVGERHVWWNFVSSRKERIDQAGKDWENHRFPPVPGEDERIPLPQ